jgi:hypothetical protein
MPALSPGGGGSVGVSASGAAPPGGVYHRMAATGGYAGGSPGGSQNPGAPGASPMPGSSDRVIATTGVPQPGDAMQGDAANPPVVATPGTPIEPGGQPMNVPPGADRIIARSGPATRGGAAGGYEEPNPLARLAVPGLGTEKAPSRPTPPPLGRLIGNRDFIMTVECHADYVTVQPGGQRFRYQGKDTRASDQALAQYVQQLIQRRKATERPGEPPYRPALRFQVAPDGLRTYMQVYPRLEFLRVPMTRENLEE